MLIQQVHVPQTVQWRKLGHEYVSEIINRYTDHTSKSKVDGPLRGVDVFHLHCTPPPWMTRDHLSRTLMFFHGIPRLALTRQMLGHVPTLTRDRCFIPPQQHAIYYREFAGMRMLRNPILVDDLEPEPLPTDAVRVVVPCSCTGYRGSLAYKGYEEVVHAVSTVAAESRGRLRYDHFVGVPRDEYVRRIMAANVVIDSLANPSYARINLEGAAAGRVSINWMSPEIDQLLRRVSGSRSHPFYHVHLDNLQSALRRMVERGPSALVEKAKRARRWMVRYWHPRDIAQDYINAYEFVCGLPRIT